MPFCVIGWHQFHLARVYRMTSARVLVKFPAPPIPHEFLEAVHEVREPERRGGKRQRVQRREVRRVEVCSE